MDKNAQRPYTLSEKETVLKYLLSVRELIKPVGLFDQFKGITRRNVGDILDTLVYDELISVSEADFPESDNIHYIMVLPLAYNYFALKWEAERLRKKDVFRTWWQILAAGVLGFILSLLAAYLAGFLKITAL